LFRQHRKIHCVASAPHFIVTTHAVPLPTREARWHEKKQKYDKLAKIKCKEIQIELNDELRAERQKVKKLKKKEIEKK
jgi:hypothetical protein